MSIEPEKKRIRAHPHHLHMSLSSFALILGVFCYVFGFPLVFSDEKHMAWRRKFLKDENMLRLLAVAVISIAVTTLRRQHEISPDGEGAIVLIAWIVLLKGLFMAWWPVQFSKVREMLEDSLLDNDAMQVFTGFVMVLLGALFTYLGLVLA